jgi:hypothetical protein
MSSNTQVSIDMGGILYQNHNNLIRIRMAVSASKSVEKREPLYAIGSNVNWYSQKEYSMSFLK